MFVIVYGSKPGCGPLYYGKGWRPYAAKKSAVRFSTRQSAEERLEGVRRVFAANPDWDQKLIEGAKIVEVVS